MALTKVSYSLITGAPINVLDKGADPTGMMDSSSAIQAAINAGSTVLFPSGTYLLASPVTLANNTRLIGQNATLRKSSTMSAAMISATSVDNVIIANLSIDGNYSIQATGVPTIEFTSVTNSKLYDLNCTDLGANVYVNSGAIKITDSENVAVQNCVIDNTWGMNTILIVGASGDNCCVNNCTITNTISDSPIAVNSSINCKVINNYISFAPGSLISYNANLGIISGNQLTANSGLNFNGITVGHPTGLYDASFTIVTDNIISQGDNGGYGIVVQNADRNIVANNYVFGGALAGIVTGGTNTTIQSNTIVDTPIGISATSAATQAIISSNNVSRFSTQGITISASSVISNNRLVSIIGSAQGININAQRSAITGNYINVPGVTVATPTSAAIDGATLYRSNIINDAPTSETITLGASSTSTILANANIVAGGLIYLQPLDANFASREVFISSVAAGSAVLTYLTGSASSCRVVYL
jgi:parallel beta-helix repeat protein